MAVSNSHLSYNDCYTVMDQALADDRGVRVAQPDINACTFFRMRIHQARSIDRNRNKKVYQDGDALYGTSQYDSLVIRIRVDDEDNYWVYVEKIEAGLGKVEALSEISEQASLPPPRPQVLLPPPSTLTKRRF